MATRIAKRKFQIQPSTNTLIEHNPDHYKSILEASERGELWGISTQQNYFIQLKIEFDCPKTI